MAFGFFGQVNDDIDTIMFSCQTNFGSMYPYSFKKHNIKQFEESPNKLFLLSKSCKYPIFEVIPKTFSISTKNGTSYFNIDMLKETSPVITSFVNNNPTENHYFLNISDEENALSKFEQLYLGKKVVFDEDEIPSSQKITKILQIKNCPNYLKPESLQSNEYQFVNYNIKSGLEINHEMLINYLRSSKLPKFTIRTNKKEYECNIFGVYSSNVIRKILEKDQTTKIFVFDFEDENEEFQLICDLFNFQQIDIKSDNMDLLKEIAESLEINCIIKQIDDYINSYEKFSEKVDEQQTIIDSIDNLFDLLYNIKNYGITKVKFSITQTKWCQKEENVQELSAFILQVIRSNIHLQNEMAELLIELNNEANESNNLNILIPLIVEKLMKFYMPNKSEKEKEISPIKNKFSQEENHFFYPFIRILYKKGIISKELINEKLKYYNFQNKSLNAFFLPELIELDPKNADLIIQRANFLSGMKGSYALFIKKYLPDKIEEYKNMLENFEPDDELTKSLQNDDVDTFQSIIIGNEIAIQKSTVPYNLFDNFNNNLSFINYAALYGSVKCFKYLLLNDAKVDEITLLYAVTSGNTEIIKIVDQKINEMNDTNQNKFSNRNLNDQNIISSTIKMHRNELFDWIFEKLYVSKGKIGNELNTLAEIAASNGNIHALIELLDKGLDISSCNAISFSAKNGFLKLTKLLLNMIDSNSIIKIINDNELSPIASVYFGNLSIFKLFSNLMNKQNQNRAILEAFEFDYNDIINYFFDNENNFENSVDFILSALNESFKKENDELFVFLFDKFIKYNPEIFDLKLFEKLLNCSCLYSKLQITQKITDIILKENPNQNFATAFISAASKGSINICQYFIDKKVYINYDQLSNHIKQLGLIDVELFQLIINNANPILRNNFLNCIDDAISNKNKKLIKFLLEKNAPIQNSLFIAVMTHDVEIVDLILKYNSKPSFINQKSPSGTALHVAVSNNDFEIVKRLLSIKGINPSLFNNKRQCPLSTAISNCNHQIIELILNFYGDDIQHELCILRTVFASLTKLIGKPNYSKKEYLKIINLLIDNKKIDNNFFNLFTILIKACEYNFIDVVKLLLKLDEIDVNTYEKDTYNTPLIFAIQSGNEEIVDILIKHPKIDINLVNIKYESPLIIAVKKNLPNIVQNLITNEKFDPIESKINHAFNLSNNEKISNILISSNLIDLNNPIKNSSFDYQNPKNCVEIALLSAITQNNSEKIDLILNHPSFSIESIAFNKAVFFCIGKNKIDIFRKLISLNNNNVINMKNQQNESILISAVNNLSDNIIDEIFNNPQFDPNNNQIVDSLLILLSNQSENAFFGNSRDKVVEIMNKIFDFDKKHSNLIDFNKLLPNGKSYFTSILNAESSDSSDFLLDHGADPNIPDKDGIYPLEHAININSFPFVDSLINSNKINYNQLSNGNSYLHIAAKNMDPKIFYSILEKDLIDLNKSNENGDTPLIEACKSKNIDAIIRLFNEDNLDYLHCNKNGIDALNIVKKLNLDEYEEARKSKDAYCKKLVSLIQS